MNATLLQIALVRRRTMVLRKKILSTSEDTR